MPTKKKLERLTVGQAEKANDSQLFVLNKSNPPGNVNFVVVDEAQQKVPLQVPKTFIPVDLTNFSTRRDILRNPNFRRLVARGFLHIVDTEDSEEFLKDDRAWKEHNRIYEVVSDLGEGFQPSPEDSLNAVPPDSKGGNVSQFAQNMLLRVADEDADSLVNELESKFDTMSVPDIEYILNGTTNSKIKEWCAEALEVAKDDNDE